MQNSRNRLTLLVGLALFIPAIGAVDWQEFEWSSQNLRFTIPANFKVKANTKTAFIAGDANDFQLKIEPFRSNSRSLSIDPKDAALFSVKMDNLLTQKQIIRQKELNLNQKLKGYLVVVNAVAGSRKVQQIYTSIIKKDQNEIFNVSWQWPDSSSTNEDNLDLVMDIAKSFQLIE